MSHKVLSILFMTTILMTAGIAASVDVFQDAEARKAAPTYIQKYGSKTGVCGDKLCSELTAEEAKQAKLQAGLKEGEEYIAGVKEQREMGKVAQLTPTQERMIKELQEIANKIASGQKLSKSEMQRAEKAMEFMQANVAAQEYYQKNPYAGPDTTQESAKKLAESTEKTMSAGGIQHISKEQTASSTITSVQDPGQGHEGHQLAVILPPSENVYVGRMTFTASEPVQYVMLHGPLGPGEDNGQPVWSPDGKTKYALTFVDQKSSSGGWWFAGNAVALHTMNEKPFTATYSVAYREIAPGDYSQGVVKSGTVHSSQDPGIGHEGHSLAIILPPRENPYRGSVLAYSASENVQLVALHGPLAQNDVKGQPTWTPDGTTHYGLTLVDPGNNMGVWNTFSGNALAAHTMNSNGFTVSYSVVAGTP